MGQLRFFEAWRNLWINVFRAGWSVASNLDNRFLVFRHRKVLHTGLEA
jgi:hypothetical protein